MFFLLKHPIRTSQRESPAFYIRVWFRSQTTINKTEVDIGDDYTVVFHLFQVDGETGTSWTYAQLIERMECAAAGFQNFGIKQDDVICVYAPNHLDFIVAFYASALIDSTFQPINPMYTEGKKTIDIVYRRKVNHWYCIHKASKPLIVYTEGK